MREASTSELIAIFFKALNAHDTETLLTLVTDDLIHDNRFGERQIGSEKFRWSIGLNAQHFREHYEDITIMLSAGGTRAAAEITLKGIYISKRDSFPKAENQNYSISAGMFFEIDENKISRITTYIDYVSWRNALAQ